MSGQKNDAIYAATVAFAVATMRELGWMPPSDQAIAEAEASDAHAENKRLQESLATLEQEAGRG